MRRGDGLRIQCFLTDWRFRTPGLSGAQVQGRASVDQSLRDGAVCVPRESEWRYGGAASFVFRVISCVIKGCSLEAV